MLRQVCINYVNGHTRLFTARILSKVNTSQKHTTPLWLAKNSAKARPQHSTSAFTVHNMLLLGYIQATKGSPRTHYVIFSKGHKKPSGLVGRELNWGLNDF